MRKIGIKCNDKRRVGCMSLGACYMYKPSVVTQMPCNSIRSPSSTPSISFQEEKGKNLPFHMQPSHSSSPQMAAPSPLPNLLLLGSSASV
jgi:hypothetical protein